MAAPTDARSAPGARRRVVRRVQPRRLLLAPAQVGAGLDVLAVDAGHRLGGDQRHAGVGVAADLLAGLGVLDAGLDAHRGHLQRVLLRGRGDHAGAHVLDAVAAAVDRDDDHALVLAGLLQRVVGAGRGGLVDRVDEVDVGRLLQAVLHRRLALGAVAEAVGHADHLGVLAELVALRVGRRQAEALQEAVVALRADRVAGEQVERDDLGRLAAERRLGVLADQHAGLVVVGGEERVGGVGRVGRAVERDHHHALVARLLDRRDDGLAVARRDQDRLRAGGDHVLHRRHLAGVVAVGLAGAGQQLGALGLGGLGRRLPSSSRRRGWSRSW